MESRRLSALAKGRGLLNGGVEVECIPDYRQSSLSGDTFLSESSSTSGKHAKIYKPYSLSLPKTYVTQRGQMMLFTSPEDMIIGRGLQDRVNEISHEAVTKVLNSTEKLRNTTENLEVSEGAAGIKPGHFTSVYLNTLRSVQQADDEGNSPSDVQLSAVSDSGIDSSQSHQTIANITSGRTSSMSYTTTESAIVIPPNNTEDTAPHGVSRSELTDIMLTIPTPRPSIIKEKKSTVGNSKRPNKKTTKKKSVKTASIRKSLVDVAKDNDEHEGTISEDKAIPTATSTGTTGVLTGTSTTTNKKGKSKNKVKRKQKKNNASVVLQITSSDSDHECEIAHDDDHSDSEYGSCTVISSELTSNETNKTSSKDDKKAMMAAKANERRLMIEKKRQELEAMKASKQLEEERNRLLKEQLMNQDDDPSMSSDGEVEITQIPTNTIIQDHIEDVNTTNNEDNNRDDSEQPVMDNKQKLLAAIQEKKQLREKIEQDQPTKTPEHKDKPKSLQANNRHKQIVQPETVKLKENKVDYRTQLQTLGATTQPVSGYFSYFSYLPTKKKHVKKRRR